MGDQAGPCGEPGPGGSASASGLGKGLGSGLGKGLGSGLGGRGLGPRPRSAKPGGAKDAGVAGLAGGLEPRPSSAAPAATPHLSKRLRPKSGDNLLHLGDTEPTASGVAEPLIQPAPPTPSSPPETMIQFAQRIRDKLSDSVSFQSKQAIDSDGLYVHKRPIRGLGPSNPLSAGGTVFYHVLLYVKQAGKLTALDYGPADMADATQNFMEEVEARPVMNGSIGGAVVPEEDTLPFLWVDTPLRGLSDSVVQEALEFVDDMRYHAVNNNCIHVTEFLARVLTGGLVKGVPLLYDAVCGQIPQQDPPMLLMLPLLMQKTWHQICDGSHLMKEFLTSHSFPPLIAQLDSSKRHESASADISKPVQVVVDQVKPSSEDQDEDAQYNTANYWKAPYYHLHVVPDDV